MTRRLIVAIVLLAFLIGAGFVGYDRYFSAPPSAVAPIHVDSGDKLPTQPEFDELAKTDPVKLLSTCLTRYEREVRGLHCTMEKQERVQGKPKHPDMPEMEVIDLWVRGDVPDAKTKQTAIEVVMKWRSGAKRVLFAEVQGTLFSEKPAPEGLDKKVVTWRPEARGVKLSLPLEPNSGAAQGQSRYCIRDAGLYRSMLRTHEAWKGRQEAGEFKYEYLGTKAVEKAGGRECHAIRRICPRTELDAFELGGTAPTDPKTVAAEGFTEVVIYIDRERWVQVGTEQYRTEPDGTRVTLGTYFFRDVELNPTFASDTFTTEGLKK